MQTDIIPNLPCQQRVLVCRVVPNEQESGCAVHVAHGCGRVPFSAKRRSKSREVRRAMVVDIVGLQHRARKLLQEIVLFVGGPIGANDSDALTTFYIPDFSKPLSDELEGFFPRRRGKAAIPADQWLLDSFL